MNEVIFMFVYKIFMHLLPSSIFIRYILSHDLYTLSHSLNNPIFMYPVRAVTHRQQLH